MIVRELLAKFGVEYDDHGAKEAEEGLAKLVEGAKKLVEFVGGVEAVHKFGEFIKSQIELGEGVYRASRRIGVGAEALQELRFAAQSAGMSAGMVDSSLQRLSRSMSMGAAGSKSQLEAFAELDVGLDQAALSSMTFEEVLNHVADGLAKTKKQGDRLRIGTQLLTRQGVGFVESLQGGAEALEEMRKKKRELGLLTDEDVKASHEAAEAMDRYHGALQGAKIEISRGFIPWWTRATDVLTHFIAGAKEASRHSHLLGLALSAAAVGVAILAAPLLAAALPAIGLAVALALIIATLDDIIGFAEGKKSVAGAILEAIWGEDGPTEGRKLLLDTVSAVGKAFKDLGVAFRDSAMPAMFDLGVKIADVWERVAAAIQKAQDLMNKIVPHAASLMRQLKGGALSLIPGIGPALSRAYLGLADTGAARAPEARDQTAYRGIYSPKPIAAPDAEAMYGGANASFPGQETAMASADHFILAPPVAGQARPAKPELNFSIQIDLNGNQVDPAELATMVTRRIRTYSDEYYRDMLTGGTP